MKPFYFFLFTCFSIISSSAQLDWTTLENAPSNGSRYDDAYFINEQLGWIANGPSGFVSKTEDGGQTWTTQLDRNDVGTLPYFRNIEFFNEDIGVVVSLENHHYRTINGGTTWTPLSFPNNPPAVCGLSALNSTTMYGCGAFNMPAFILKTDDSGETWTYTDMSPLANALVEILFLNENVGYASGRGENGGVILKTIDGGTTWNTIYTSPIAGEYVWKLQFVEGDSNVLFASIQSVAQNPGKIIKSFDAGATWESKDCPITPIQGIGFINQNRGWVGGHVGNLFETIDGGDTWTDLGYGAGANRIFFIEDTAYGATRTMLKLTDTTLSNQDFNNTIEDKLSVTIAPAPVKDKLEIAIDYLRNDNALIELYDTRGRFLTILKRDVMVDAGKKNYSFDFNYPSGTYFLIVQNNNGLQSIPFIKE